MGCGLWVVWGGGHPACPSGSILILAKWFHGLTVPGFHGFGGFEFGFGSGWVLGEPQRSHGATLRAGSKPTLRPRDPETSSTKCRRDSQSRRHFYLHLSPPISICFHVLPPPLIPHPSRHALRVTRHDFTVLQFYDFTGKREVLWAALRGARCSESLLKPQTSNPNHAPL